jgi:hypothetical protein
MLDWSHDTAPILKKPVVKVAAVTRYRGLPFDLVEALGKSRVLIVGHFISVGFGVTPRIVDVRGVTIEEGALIVIKVDDFQSRAILDLNSQKAVGNVG